MSIRNSLIGLFLLLATAAQADGVSTGIGGSDGISGGSVGGGSGISGAGVKIIQFFVNTATGNDGAAGSQAAPWLTLNKVNTSVFQPNTIVNLQGTFAVAANTLAITATVAPSGRVTFTSYGAGATIQSGNTAACVTVTNVPSVTVSNLTCTGGGNTTNTTNGIFVVNSLAGNAKIAGPTISGNTVTGYGLDGISVNSTAGTAGFNGITISNNTVHDSTGNGNATSCIQVHSTSGYGTNNVHTSVMVSGNLVFNCTGKVSQAAWSGSGILVRETSGATIQFNVAHDFGVNNTNAGGPVGIWGADGTNLTIQFNEVYNGQAGAGGGDGGAYDLDGGTSNSILQYNYGHNNFGSCLLLFGYNDGIVTSWSSNTARYNICENNNTGNVGAEINIDSSGGTFTGALAYNNTTYVSSIGLALNVGGSGGTVTSGNVANNIFYGTAAKTIAIVTSNALGVTLNFNDYFGSAKFTYNAISYTTLATYQAGSTQDTNSIAASPLFSGTAGAGGTCYISGTPAGPQPCPTPYAFFNTSSLIGTGTAIASPGSRDYYGNAIPNGSGTGYNIGAYGGLGTAPPAFQGAGDVIANATVWYGVRAYTAAYAVGAGKIANVIRASDSHTCDILAASNGGLGVTASCSTGGDNGQAASSFCNATTCKIVTLYDQSGAHSCTGSTVCDLTQATSANQPTLTFNCIGSLPCMTMGVTIGVNKQSNVFSLAQPFTYSQVFRPTNMAGCTQVSCAIFTSDSGGNFIETKIVNTNNTFRIEANSAGSATCSAALSNNTSYAAQAMFNGASTVSYINSGSNVCTGTLGVSGIQLNLWIGENNAAAAEDFVGNIMESGIWPGAFNGTQQSNMDLNQRTYWGF